MQQTNDTHSLTFTRRKPELRKLTRRELLKRSLAVTGSLMVGSGFVMSSKEAWAMETSALSPETMATLIQMARDVYPHDSFGDHLYAAAVKGHDETAAKDAEFKSLIENGVATLNKKAKEDGAESYIASGWEADRTAILKSIESDPFFQTIRGGLVVGLYNQPEVWAHLGYEGSSFEKGGYINRGFDDIDWL